MLKRENNGQYVLLCLDVLKSILHDKSQPLNGEFLKPYSQYDDDYVVAKMKFASECRKAANQCQSKVTIAFYMQLLVNLFSKDPSSRAVRFHIAKLFSNKEFQSTSINLGQISSDSHILMERMRNLNFSL